MTTLRHVVRFALESAKTVATWGPTNSKPTKQNIAVLGCSPEAFHGLVLGRDISTGDAKHGLDIGTKSTKFFGVRELVELKEHCS